MKKFKKIFLVIILICIISTITFFVGKQIGLNTDVSSTSTTIEEQEVSTRTIAKTLTATGEIATATTEKLTLDTTKYFETMCVEEDDTVKEGENILKYTNGTFLVAPYDCVIIKLNIPSNSGKCTNEHYVSISSVNVLAVQFKVDESKISDISVGKSALIKVSALEEKEFNGYVTKISSTANNGSFTVTAEFENDSDVKIGMTATVEL